MTAQTSYSQDPGGPFAGMISDLSMQDRDAVRSAETSANMPFGVGVVDVSAPGTVQPAPVVLPTSATATLHGIAIFHHARNQSIASTGAIVPNEVFDVLRKGRITVISETAITDLTPANRVVHMRIGGTGQLGGFRNSAVTGQTVTVAGARFNKLCGAGGLTELELSDNTTLTAD